MRNMRSRLFVFAVAVCVMTGLSFAQAKLKPDQLLGVWARTGAADMSGLEFAKGGKVSVYYGGGNEALAGEYAIGDDGRLSLSMGGLSEFFLPTLSGDQLQLKNPVSGDISQYRRLKAGETVAGAIAAQETADKKLVANRNAALPDFLKRHDLVMAVINGGNAFPASSALEFAPNGNDFAGRICYDSKPPRVEAVGAQFQGSSENPSVAIWFGPGTAQQNKMMFLFHANGAAPNITLISHVSFGGFGDPANSTVIIKSDDALHKGIIEHLQTETTRLNALKAPVAALLKSYAILKGTSQSNLPAQREGFADQFVLARNPQNNTWIGEGQLVNRATGATEIFPVVAGVGIMSGKPVIQILSQKRMYVFSNIDAASGKLSGAWQMPRDPNGRAAELTIAQAVDDKGRDALFAASKKALQQLGAATVFHAVLNDQNTNAQPPNPIAVTISVGADGAIAGKADYPLEGVTITLAGKAVDSPLGPKLQIRYSGGQANPGAWSDAKPFLDSVQHETWLLSPDLDSAGTLRLGGFAVTKPALGAASNTLQLIPYTEKDKADIAKALADGVRFRVIYPQMGNIPDDILEFKTDPATNKINGKVAAGGHRMNTPLGQTFSGDMKDQVGWTVLQMPLSHMGHPPDYAYTIVVTPTDAGLYLNGYVYSIRRGAASPLGRWDAVQVKP